jgi:hypothetical protein
VTDVFVHASGRDAANPLLTRIASPNVTRFNHTFSHKSINMTEKYETSPDLESQHIDGAPLNRTNTSITLSNEQYERLFFQPSAPRAGDAAKRFGEISRVHRNWVSPSDTPS